MPKSKPLIFLDSSVLFSATKSKLGGSFRLLQECERTTFRPVISQRVVKEVQLRLQEKYPQFLPQFYHLLVRIDFKIVNPTISLIN